MHSRILHEVGPSSYWASTTLSTQSCCYNTPNSVLLPSLLPPMYPAELSFLQATFSGRPSDCTHCYRLRPLCTSTSPVPHPRPTAFPNWESRALRMACQVPNPKGRLQKEGEIFNPPSPPPPPPCRSSLLPRLVTVSLCGRDRHASREINQLFQPSLQHRGIIPECTNS